MTPSGESVLQTAYERVRLDQLRHDVETQCFMDAFATGFRIGRAYEAGSP